MRNTLLAIAAIAECLAPARFRGPGLVNTRKSSQRDNGGIAPATRTPEEVEQILFGGGAPRLLEPKKVHKIPQAR